MLKDKVAIITGGSRGIGSAICLDFASKGANVVVNYSGNKEAALKTVAQCEEYGVKAIAIKADIGNSSEVEYLVQETMNAFGKIDILVNNAGITRDNLILRMSDQEFDDVIQTNLKGTYLCMKQISKIMIKQRHGRIINMSSVVGIAGNSSQVNYAASKAGVIGMTKSLAKELARRSITVNAVAPGYIRTDMTSNLPEAVTKQLLDSIPLGRLGEVTDIAKTVSFLASDDASYITGQVINVNGGMLM